MTLALFFQVLNRLTIDRLIKISEASARLCRVVLVPAKRLSRDGRLLRLQSLELLVLALEVHTQGEAAAAREPEDGDFSTEGNSIVSCEMST